MEAGIDIFRRLFFVALAAGVLSGILIAAVHQVSTAPIILRAEVFEKAADAAKKAAEAQTASTVHRHEHAATPWKPKNGVERTAYTGLADILTGIGFALLLVAAYALKNDKVDWRRGLLWGLAGFATFTLAPGLGLPPEVPGTAAAPLLDRQIWWCATALLTGGGLALLIFKRRADWAMLAVAMIVLPHVVGAAAPAEHVNAAPEALAHRFIVAVMVTSLLFWLSLGASTGYLYRRFIRSA